MFAVAVAIMRSDPVLRRIEKVVLRQLPPEMRAKITMDAIDPKDRRVANVASGTFEPFLTEDGKPADVFAAEGPHLPLWLEQPLFGFIQ